MEPAKKKRVMERCCVVAPSLSNLCRIVSLTPHLLGPVRFLLEVLMSSVCLSQLVSYLPSGGVGYAPFGICDYTTVISCFQVFS